ncbi:MAG: hypothetical protein GXY40_00450 [Syntrophomonadaceae bacterium]|jgi:hypothetical protein|nr:hypothetical protein [Syntrophomonadaceae bacterium]
MAIGEYINIFFDQLEIWEDNYGKKENHKDRIYTAIRKFQENSTTEAAQDVYESFFRSYWIGIQTEVNPFIELLNKMKNYEQQAGQLLKSHRDHYVHSVNVFLLGLAIYATNPYFQRVFSEKVMNKAEYPDSYDTKNEEFFYRWGLASLFHDMAYPLDITLKQANQYIKFVCSYPMGDYTVVRIRMRFPEFTDNNELSPLLPVPEYEGEFAQKYPGIMKLDGTSSGDIYSLIAIKLHECFGLDYELLRAQLRKHVDSIEERGMIDHGYCSAVIMLWWYHYLFKSTRWNPAYFYFPVVDAASAILLHTFYPHLFMKEPFNLGKIYPENHPIAYLLILCDELQDWDRKTYGTSARDQYKCDLNLSGNNMQLIYYETEKDILEHIKKKRGDIDKILQLECLFPEGCAFLIQTGRENNG